MNGRHYSLDADVMHKGASCSDFTVDLLPCVLHQFDLQRELLKLVPVLAL